MHLPSPPAPLHRGWPAAPEEPELPLVSRRRAAPAAMGTVVTQSDAYEQRCHIAKRDVTPPHGCYCPPFVAGSRYPSQELQTKPRRGFGDGSHQWCAAPVRMCAVTGGLVGHRRVRVLVLLLRAAALVGSHPAEQVPGEGAGRVLRHACPTMPHSCLLSSELFGLTRSPSL